MITEHRLPLRDTAHQFAGEIQWQPARKPLRWLRAFMLSGLGWGLLIGAIFAAMCIVANGGLITP